MLIPYDKEHYTLNFCRELARELRRSGEYKRVVVIFERLERIGGASINFGSIWVERKEEKNMELRPLTQEEKEQIYDAAVCQMVEDCKQDDSFLSHVIQTHLEGLTIDDWLSAICEDDDLLIEVLGFNPYQEEK